MKDLLDTNIISETWKPRPHPAVREWLEALTLSRGLVVVTRNTGDFRQVPTLNPWPV
ncbi:MAG: hypothetical protein HY674_11570 [Chloroflexi bacterium]|nr:hypothetical protein [Chloroflexota bacterium]